MSLNKKVMAYLDGHHYHYTTLTHSPTETAMENARVLDWPRSKVAKVIACNADGENILLALPANEKVHMRSLQDNLGYSKVRMLNEKELASLFPDCEVGAHTPFASMYGMSLVLSNHFDKNSEIVVNAGNHAEALKLPLLELIENENPQTVEFSVDKDSFDEYRAMYYTWM